MSVRLISLSVVLTVLVGGLSAPVARAQEPQPAQQKKKKKKRKMTGTHTVWVMSGASWKRDAKWALGVMRAIASAEKDVVWAPPYIEPPVPEENIDELEALYVDMKKNYSKGKKWLKKERYKKARQNFEKARKNALELIARAGFVYKFRKKAVYSSLYLGVIVAQLGDPASAVPYFRYVCAVWPGFPVPKSFPDQLKEMYHEACHYKMDGNGIIVVNSSEPGFFFIDGRLMGITPGRIVNVPPGVHYVTWARMGYAMEVKELRVGEGATAVADFQVRKEVYYSDLEEIKAKITAALDAEEDADSKLLAKIAKKVRVRRILVVRPVGRRLELSYLDREQGWIKRVRRTVKGPSDTFGTMLASVFVRPEPKFDYKDPVVKRKRRRCYSDSDCPVGKECVAGRCVRSTPFYKKWWFWTAVGAGVTAVGAGGYLLYQLSTRPSIEIRSTL